MKRTIAAAAVAVMCLAAAPGRAAQVDVNIVGFQYVTSGWATVDPFAFGGGAGTVAFPMEATVPMVHRGDVILFSNRDPVPHTVFKVSGPGGSWGDIRIDPMTNKSLTITNNTLVFPNGLYTYRCSIHGGMRGAFRVA